jgi:DNA-binding transcriptional LysR family regulator
MDKFAAMRVFVRIADAGNLSAAGRQLGLSLTSVSRQLMALEEALGTTLVERTTRHLSLTESGRLYYERAKQILEEVAEMERGLTTGRLRPDCPQARRHPACCLPHRIICAGAASRRRRMICSSRIAWPSAIYQA